MRLLKNTSLLLLSFSALNTPAILAQENKASQPEKTAKSPMQAICDATKELESHAAVANFSHDYDSDIATIQKLSAIACSSNSELKNEINYPSGRLAIKPTIIDGFQANVYESYYDNEAHQRVFSDEIVSTSDGRKMQFKKTYYPKGQEAVAVNKFVDLQATRYWVFYPNGKSAWSGYEVTAYPSVYFPNGQGLEKLRDIGGGHNIRSMVYPSGDFAMWDIERNYIKYPDDSFAFDGKTWRTPTGDASNLPADMPINEALPKLLGLNLPYQGTFKLHKGMETVYVLTAVEDYFEKSIGKWSCTCGVRNYWLNNPGTDLFHGDAVRFAKESALDAACKVAENKCWKVAGSRPHASCAREIKECKLLPAAKTL